MCDPLVSVIICGYNGERFLRPTIDSVLAQSWTAFELLIVDDGSADGSVQLARSYRDPRIRIIEQRNQGPAAALATGLAAAGGEYVAFLDQDDLWEPNKLAGHLSVHKSRPGIDLTFSWFQVIDESGRQIGVHSRRFHGSVDFGYLLEDFVIAGSSNVVARRAAIEKAGGIDPEIARLYDLDICLRVALLAEGNVEAVPADLVRYRRHCNQITRDWESMKREWEMVLKKMLRLAPDQAIPRQHKARSNCNRYWARLAYESEAYGDALRMLSDGFRNVPGYFTKDPRNWTTAAACLSGWILPRSWHHALERMAGLKIRN